ncbi:hypothetical protein ACEN8K_46150, partial [Variovorax sp. CT11-76]
VQAPAAQAHVHPHGIASLFGLHTDAECRLYDQLAHGASAPGVPLVVLPVLLPAATFAWLQGEALAPSGLPVTVISRRLVMGCGFGEGSAGAVWARA